MHTDLINCNIIIQGDFNGRMGVTTGDHDENYLGKRILLPFIKQHNLKILNTEQCYGQTTSIANNGKSIIDLILINKNIKEQEIDIHMSIYPDTLGSDHHPIESRIKYNNNNKQMNINKPMNISNNDKFFNPLMILSIILIIMTKILIILLINLEMI